MEITQEKLDWYSTIDFRRGPHRQGDSACAMEAAAYIAGEPWSDHPKCVCPVIAAFMRIWNDALPDEDRTRLLKPLVLMTLGTRSTLEAEKRRSLLALDWLIRTHAAAWLDLTDELKPHARELRALPEVTDGNAKMAGAKVRAARAAARAAAGDAAWDAARDAARAAAGTAVRETTTRLQASAIVLVERMCAVGNE